MLKITATEMTGGDLKPGDLFSGLGQAYWDTVTETNCNSVGEKVYIRTLAQAADDDKDTPVYKITVTYND